MTELDNFWKSSRNDERWSSGERNAIEHDKQVNNWASAILLDGRWW
jgi:hypothetical protein